MKLPFISADPNDALRTAQAALAQAETMIAELARDRAAKLLEPDYAGGVETIDRQIEAHRRAVAVHRDRIAAMVERRRADERARLEREKADKIADMGKRLARRDAAAQLLETALAGVRKAHAELVAADEAIFPPHSGFNYLSTTSMAPLCRRDRRPSDPMPRTIIGPVRAIADGAGTGLAEEIQQKGRDLLEILQAEPIPEPDDENDDSEIAA